MAKKKSHSMLKVLFDVVALVLGALVFVLLATTHINSVVYNALSSKQEVVATLSGYQLINFGDGYDTGVAVVLLVLAVLAGLTMLFAALKLLCDIGLVKNASVKKFTTFGFVASALLLVVMAIVSMIVVSSYAGKNYNETLKLGLVANWFMLILEAVVALGTSACAILSWKK